jgi:ribonuclease Y
VVKKVSEEVDGTIKEAGEQATFDLGVHGIHPELIRFLGRLKYRTSYAQNVLQHSIEVGFLCGIMASELGLNPKIARRMGLLHDLGKAIDHEVEGPHAVIGADMAKKFGESNRVVHAIAAHHEDDEQNAPHKRGAHLRSPSSGWSISLYIPNQWERMWYQLFV